LDIDLTRSEKSTFFRFLSLYLGSSFILLVFIGVFYFQKEKSLYFDLLKSNMQNITSKISSEIIISHMQVYSFNKEKYVDSGRYEGSFASKRKKYLESKEYKIAFYDENQKKMYGSLDDKIDFSQTIQFNNKDLILIDNSTVGHLGIGYIVIKDQSFDGKIADLKTNIVIFFLALYLIIALIGVYLAKLFLKPIKDEREKLNNFIKDTTHELNTPISAILMSTESNNLSEKQIHRIRISAKKVSEVYKDISYVFLQNSSIQKNIEVLNLAEMIKEQLEYFEPLINKKRIKISTKLEDFSYEMNRDDFVRIFNNIISNAIKYNKISGEINIVLENRKLSISDTGIGIEEKKLNDIFKRYFRATAEQGGFGIGLNIVNHICQDYNIKIDVKSTFKKNTTFILTF